MTMFPLPAILALVAAVRLSEIQASPTGGSSEFVEISGPPALGLAGWTLSDGAVERPLPSSAALSASGLLVVSPDCSLLRSAWADADIPCLQVGTWGRLSVETDCVILRDATGRLADSVCWNRAGWGEWPRGRSRFRAFPEREGSDPGAWKDSRAPGGASPGWTEPPESVQENQLVLGIVRRTVRPGGVHLWELRAAGTVRVEVFDLARRPLGMLYEGEPPEGGELRWDGRIAGRNLTPGVYLVVASSRGELRREWIAVGKP